ncbi:MAG: hypothetical protein R2795_22135 [Saprospiraceae bacterium]
MAHRRKIKKPMGMQIGSTEERFLHDETLFPLEGRHGAIDCRDCHTDLVFENVTSQCLSCHTDIHERTVGNDCNRCHSSDNWLVDDIYGLHISNGFR